MKRRNSNTVLVDHLSPSRNGRIAGAGDHGKDYVVAVPIFFVLHLAGLTGY